MKNNNNNFSCDAKTMAWMMIGAICASGVAGDLRVMYVHGFDEVIAMGTFIKAMFANHSYNRMKYWKSQKNHIAKTK